MRFGLESEKILFDLKEKQLNHGVMRLVDAISDYTSALGEEIVERVTNEFVINMVEINSNPSSSLFEVCKNVLLCYSAISDIAARENSVLLPVSALPYDFTPTMVPKWDYYLQNSILSGKRLRTWTLDKNSPLRDAGNCSGLHVHSEIETLPEFLVFGRELVDKHNLALMLTPLIAFSASPYFYFEHSAYSMRAKRYYFGVYKNFPLNGGIPDVMSTSQEVLSYYLSGIEHWVHEGLKLGFAYEDLQKFTAKKGASWGMLRWNRRWNTIELRCLESDRVDLDLAKFVLAAGVMRRSDLEKEALQCEPIKQGTKLDKKVIEDAFQVSGNKVQILNSELLKDLLNRALEKGIHDPMVEQYLYRIFEFSRPALSEKAQQILKPLQTSLEKKETTADFILKRNKHRELISEETCIDILTDLVAIEREKIKDLQKLFPDTVIRHKTRPFPMRQ